jgi:hypothetical protein
VQQPRRGSSGDDPYTPYKGINAIRAANKDRYGNPDGPQYDLARDGAFKGLQIAVLHLYTGEGFDFRFPAAALAEFTVHRWPNQPPSVRELTQVLDQSCQLWIISDSTQKLGAEHLSVIRTFFESGRGVYIWGDNEPYYADANYIARALFGGLLSGNVTGDAVVQVKRGASRSGMIPTT